MGNLARFSNDVLQGHQLCFVHIPKTAGTSFMEILQAIVGRENFFHISPEVLNGFRDPDKNIDRFACLSGHFTFEIYKLLKKTPLFITFLREPISRSISNFQEFRRVDLESPFVKQLPNYDFYLQLDKMTLQDFIDHPYFRDSVSNLQTRMLGLSIHVPVHSLADLRPIADDTRHVSLDLAKERLEQFMFVGIQEEFQRSLEMTAYQFGLFPLKEIPKLNESKQAISFEDISDSTINHLHELNHLDTELYEFGVKLFNERYHQMIAEVDQNRTKKILGVTEMLSKTYWEQKDKTQTIHYDLDIIYPRQGWHPVERIDNQQWMWSGPGNISHIDFPVDRSINLRVRFQVLYFIALDILESLELHIDNQRIHLLHSAENEAHLFTGIIPAKTGKKYIPTRLSFHVNRTAYPTGMTDESPNARLLGIAISWIEILPIE